MHLAARDGASLIERHLGHAGVLVEETVHHLWARARSVHAALGCASLIFGQTGNHRQRARDYWWFTQTHLVLRSASSGASKRVQGAIWAPVDKLVSLQTLVILDMLGKLAERVARG